MKTPLSFILALVWMVQFASATPPLDRAEITRILNQVQILSPDAAPREAHLHQVVRSEQGVLTGEGSRTELRFTDQTLARLGANTVFTFDSRNRELKVEQGAMLLQVPEGLGNTRVTSRSVTAAITGTTILYEYQPDGYVKVIAVEGTLRLYLNDRMGESILLTPGKMMILPPDATQLPEPVDVDLDRLVKTSGLISDTDWPDPGPDEDLQMAPIQAEVQEQQQEIRKGRLVPTNLLILGRGTEVILTTDELMREIETRLDASDPLRERELVQSRKEPETEPDREARPSPVGPDKFGPLPTITSPNPYLVKNSTTIVTDPVIITDGQRSLGKIYRDARQDGPLAGWLFETSDPLDEFFDITATALEGQQAGVFKFSDLRFQGAPMIDTAGGPIILGLVSEEGIVFEGGGDLPRTFAWGTLDHVALMAMGDSISIPTAWTLTGSGGLLVYLRNAAHRVDFFPRVDLDEVEIAAWGMIRFGPNIIRLDEFTLNALGDIEMLSPLGTEFGEMFFQIKTAGDLRNPNQVDVWGRPGTGSSIEVSGHIDFGGGNLTAGTIEADRVTTTGFVRADTITVAQDMSVDELSSVHTEIGGSLAVGPGGITNRDGVLDAALSPINRTLIVGGSLGSEGGINLQGHGGTASTMARDGGRLNIVTPGFLAFGNITGAINGANLSGGDGPGGSGQGGGSGGTLRVTATGNGVIFLSTTDLIATTGVGDQSVISGQGGRVELDAMRRVTMLDSRIEVSSAGGGSSSKSAEGGQVVLKGRETNPSGSAVSITSSSQILALLSTAAPGPGGEIRVESSGGKIVIDNSQLIADGGTINISNLGAGNIDIVNGSYLAADVLRVQTFGHNGQILIGNSTLSADSLMEIYARGSNGVVQFVNDTLLKGNGIKYIRGNTVQLNNGVVVTVEGPAAQVFANHARYSGSGGNGATSGQFAGSGASTSPFNGGVE